MKINCSFCGIEFEKEPSQIKRSDRHYCSRSCAAKLNNTIHKKRQRTAIRRICKNCGKQCDRPEQFYCNNKCQSIYRRKEKIDNWLNGLDSGLATNGQIKRYLRHHLIFKIGECCERCGWNQKHPVTGKCPLEIHHKDGDHKNNKEHNLEVICPNCHSLTETYKNMNKGKGRDCRRK